MPRQIAVGSVSNAMRGKRVLEQHGMRAYVRRHADPKTDHGCGYSLYLPDAAEDAERWLEAGGVRMTRERGRDKR